MRLYYATSILAGANYNFYRRIYGLHLHSSRRLGQAIVEIKSDNIHLSFIAISDLGHRLSCLRIHFGLARSTHTPCEEWKREKNQISQRSIRLNCLQG